MKRIKCCVSVILTLLLMIQIGILGFAESEVNTIFIKNAEDLNSVHNNLDGYYVLENDIDLSCFENWIPIGTKEAPFTGTFDGVNHKISNIKITGIDKNEYAGLFGYIEGANISNIKIDGEIKTKVEKISAGGICGKASNSVIDSCLNTIDIENVSSGDNPQVFLGGVVGFADKSTISKCVNSGFIGLTAKNKVYRHMENCVLGGISGFLSGDMFNSRNTGFSKVIVENQYVQVGGLVGRFTGKVISTSYNTGRLNVSYADEESAIDCYSLVGICEVFELEEENSSTKPVLDCYYLNETGNDYFGKALTKNEMKEKNNYAGFDFEDVWMMSDSYFAPVLCYESTTPSVKNRCLVVKTGQSVFVETGENTIVSSFSSNENVAVVSGSQIIGKRPGNTVVGILLENNTELQYAVKVEFSFVTWLKSLFETLVNAVFGREIIKL